MIKQIITNLLDFSQLTKRQQKFYQNGLWWEEAKSMKDVAVAALSVTKYRFAIIEY